MAPELSIVVPVYNEEDVLPLLVARLRPVADGLGTPYEVVAVDDGSTDADARAAAAVPPRAGPQLRVVRLRANAGHQAAISAGLARARGDYVVTLDADLQDPPEVIAEMLAAARDERRRRRLRRARRTAPRDSAFKRLSARAFYRLIRSMSGTHAQADAGDYRLMSRATVDAVNSLPEHHRVLRFVVPALGFPSASVSYRRDERGRRQLEVPAGQDDPALRRQRDRLLHRAPARWPPGSASPAAWRRSACCVYALVAQLLGHTLPGWTSTVVAVAGRRRGAAAVPRASSASTSAGCTR